MKLKRRILAFATMLMLLLQLTLPAFAWEQRTEAREADPVAQRPVGGEQITVQAQAAALQQPTKEEIAAKWNLVTSSATIFAEEPTITAPHVAGSLTDEFLETGLTYLNYVRFVAGLPEVTLDATLNEDAQHGAVVLAAIDELTHYPSQPEDMDDAFFERGYAATTSSNISARWGYSDLTNMLKSAVQGCMDDNNSLGNLTTVGHRRWLLNPTLGKVGFGYAESAEDWSYIVTKVFDRSGAGCSYDFISWPVAGNHPTNLFDSQNPWSVTLNPSVYQTASASDLAITITRVADGKQWSLDGTTGEPNYDSYYGYIAPYLTADSQGYGVRSCIIFHPGSEAVESYEGVFQVKITGLYYVDGTAAELNYEVDFFDISSVGCVHNYTSSVTAPTCTEQGYTTYTCSKCGDSYEDDYTDPVDHSYEDGKCIWCGMDAPNGQQCGDNAYWTYENGTLTISGQGAMYDYCWDYLAEENRPWADLLDQIHTVVVKDGITHIGEAAFFWMPNLTEVSLPDSVLTIGRDALSFNPSLETITLPGNLQEIHQLALERCTALKELTLPASLTFLDDICEGCTALKKVTILGDPALPAFVVSNSVFRWCTALEEIQVVGEHICLSVVDNALYADNTLNDYALNNPATELAIVEGTERINQFAMQQAQNVEHIILPASVNFVGMYSFSDCPNLNTVTFRGSAPELQEGIFFGDTLTARYPANDPTWTADVMQQYGGTVTWEPYEVAADAVSGICGDDATWVLTEDGTLIISGTGATYDYAYEGAPWFEYREQITAIVVNDGITRLGEYIFTSLDNLVSADLSDTITEIGSFVFWGDEKLSQAELPANLESLGQEAFARCALTSVELPGSLTFLDACVFQYCTSLTDVVIHSGNVESMAFGNSTFRGCSALENIYVDDDHFALFDMDGILYSYYNEGYELLQYPLGREDTVLEILDGTLIINMLAVEAADNLEEVIIPASLREIYTFAFSGSTNLKTIRFLGDAPAIQEYSFNGVTADCYYPAGNATWTEEVMQDYGGTITWVAYSNSLPCDNGHHVPGKNTSGSESGFCEYCDAICRTSGTVIWAIEADGDMILYGTGENGVGELSYYGPRWNTYADRVTTLTVEEGVTGPIFDFAGFVNLTTASLSNGITEIEKFTFQGCTNLEQINIPSGLTYLGSGAFRECGKLTEVSLPATVSAIGSGVFAACPNLEAIWVDESNPYYASDAQGVLYNKDFTELYQAPGKLSGHYTIPAGVAFVYDASFEGCAELTGITISEGAEFISNYVFKDCTALKTVTIAASVVELANGAFENCTALETVTFEGDAPYMMSDCFQNVTATAYYPGGNDTWTEEVMQQYGGTITWVPVYNEPFAAAFKYATTSLGGTINLNIYVEMSDSLVNDADTFVRFGCAGKTTDVPMADALASMDYGTLLYKFSLPLNAKQVSDTVTVQVMNGDEAVGKTLEYSIMKYCVNRIAKSPDAAEVAACKALLNYAAAAQMYFGYNTDNLANASLSEADKTLPTADVAQYSSKVTGSETGIKAKEATLMAESVVSVRVYFTLSDGYSIDDFTFYVDGKEVAPKQNSKGDYYVETDGIAAKNMDEMHTFTVGGLTVEYGPLCYVKNKLANSTDPVVINMVNAIYAYYKAAEAVLG